LGLIFFDVVDEGRTRRGDVGPGGFFFRYFPGLERDLVSPVGCLSYVPDAEGTQGGWKARALPFVENGRKGWRDAGCDEMSLVDESPRHVDIIAECFRLLGALADAGAAGDTALFVDVRLAVLHADRLDGARPEAPVTVPASGGQRKNDLRF